VERDEVASANEALWEREVHKGCGYTVPWLDLDPDALRRYAAGEAAPVPEVLSVMSPRSLLAEAEGKDVLCLACGGGQQSAVLSLLGGRVTVVDLAQGQLRGDVKAAAHYGYEVRTVHGDMRDLSALDEGSFDIVYGTSVCYVPDAREVYRQVARVLRPGGLYRCDWDQPAIRFLAWDGSGYVVAKPYAERVERRDDGGIEFRHYMDDIFGGLLESGFSIRQVEDLARGTAPDSQASPGTWAHEISYVGGHFVIVARREQ